MTTKAAERPTLVENIQVLQVGKYGVRIDEKTWYGVNEPLTPSSFALGGYKISLVVSKTGKKYINEILGAEVVASAPVVAAAPVIAAPVVQPKPIENKATPLKFDDKSIQIQRQGLYQAALQSPALPQWALNVTEYLSLVRQVADAGIAYVREGK